MRPILLSVARIITRAWYSWPSSITGTQSTAFQNAFYHNRFVAGVLDTWFCSLLNQRILSLMLSYTMYLANSMVNPFVYSSRMPIFKDALRKLLQEKTTEHRSRIASRHIHSPCILSVKNMSLIQHQGTVKLRRTATTGIWPPRYYGHFFWLPGKTATHFLVKKKNLVNTVKIFWANWWPY